MLSTFLAMRHVNRAFKTGDSAWLYARFSWESDYNIFHTMITNGQCLSRKVFHKMTEKFEKYGYIVGISQGRDHDLILVRNIQD